MCLAFFSWLMHTASVRCLLQTASNGFRTCRIQKAFKIVLSSYTPGNGGIWREFYTHSEQRVELQLLSILKRQFFIKHTVCQNQTSVFLDSWVTDTTSVKMLCSQNSRLSLHFLKNIACLTVCLLRIGQVSSVSCKTVKWGVTTHCSFIILIFWQQMKREQILHWGIENILRTSSSDSFLCNTVLIWSNCFQKFGLCHICEGCISYFNIIMWTKILVMRYEIGYLCLDF